MSTLHTEFERLWRGETTTRSPEHHPFHPLYVLEEVAERVGFYKAFVNITAVGTDAGLVLIDTGSFHPVARERAFSHVRRYSPEPVHTAVYTHGHVDHAYGLPPFLAEARERGWPRPAIVGHEAVPARMRRYIETAGYNAIINERQFGQPIEWPVDPDYPDVLYREALELEVGGTRVRLHHARGETDDHTWVHIPERGVLVTGDLFIWAAPNAGNPQKVQRYVIEWARALRAMAACEAEVLLPGHGLPVFGAERVEKALLDTARYLEHIWRHCVDVMNSGGTEYDVALGLRVPDELREQPFLQPVYDEPEFIARNVWRCLGGWYSGIPSELKPERPEGVAREVAALAGGTEALVRRGEELLREGELRLAAHLADWAALAAPGDRAAHELRARVYEARAEAEPSTMARGIFAAAARESGSR